MVKLRSDDVRGHWAELAPGLVPLLDEIERAEDWTVDKVPAVAERIAQLGERLSDPRGAAALEHADRERLLFVLVYMSSSKALYLIQQLDERYDGLGGRLVLALLAHGGAAIAGVTHETLASTLIKRLQFINNGPFCRAVFDPKRLDTIQRAIRAHHEESAYA